MPKKKIPWEEQFDKLKEFKRKNGHCIVSRYDKNWENLGIWVRNQRSTKKKGRLSPERIKLLNDLGFVWEVRVKAPTTSVPPTTPSSSLKPAHSAMSPPVMMARPLNVSMSMEFMDNPLRFQPVSAFQQQQPGQVGVQSNSNSNSPTGSPVWSETTPVIEDGGNSSGSSSDEDYDE
jgi:hypothetical protein